MTERIKLTKDNIIESSPNEVHIYTQGNANLKQQILDDQDKVNRLKQIFSSHVATGAPLNTPDSGITDDQVQEIHNVITDILEFIDKGTIPVGYDRVKLTVEPTP